MRYARAFWARRFIGMIGLYTDLMAEASSQSFYARLPGHPEQAADSLARVGQDRECYRFRGETDANWLARVRASWDDYDQGGSPIQLLRVLNQWGSAGWPATWDESMVTIVESVDPAVFEFEITIPFGLIDPPWSADVYGSDHVYGEIGFFYGPGASNDIPMMLWLIKKWKPARSAAFVTVHYSEINSVTFGV